MTYAERYNAAAKKLFPGLYDDLLVDPAIDSRNHIDDTVFRRSEYLGGMAYAILAMLELEDEE